MVESHVLRKLRAGDFVRVPIVVRVSEPWLAEAIGKLGFDALWLDMEHTCFDYADLGPVAIACRATGMDLIVRVRKSEYSTPMRALESGANGIMVPHCCSAAEARRWAEWIRYYPAGRRGFIGIGADADYMMADFREYLGHANREVFLILLIEDPEAVECVEEIAAVDGVDMLLVGPADLSVSYGIPMEFDHPRLQAAIDRIAAAAKKSGKWWGITTSDAEAAQIALNRGARMVTCGIDHVVLVQGFQKAQKQFANLSVPARAVSSRSE